MNKWEHIWEKVPIGNREGAKNSGGKRAGLLTAQVTPGAPVADCSLFPSQSTDQRNLHFK